MTKKNTQATSLAIKIMVSLFVLAIGIGLVLGINKCNKDRAIAKDTGTMTIVVEDISGKSHTRKIEFEKDYSMMDVLTFTYGYDLKFDTTEYGARLLGITDTDDSGDKIVIDTDFVKTYIAIYVDGKYSQKGISYIELYDGLVLKLVETKI